MIRKALLLLTTVGLGACHHEVVLPPVSPAPLAACLTFVVREDQVLSNAYDRDVQNAVRTTTETALVGAGFNVLEDDKLPHDLVAHITTVPGSRLESSAKVQSKLSLEAGGKVVAVLDATAPAEGQGYDGAIADQLVDAVFRSPDLAAFTRDLRKPESKHHLASSALRAAQEPPPPAACVSPPPAPVAPAEPAPVAPPASTEPTTPDDDFIAGAPQPNAYALIVGVDTFDHESRAPGAKADAERFARLAQRTLGVPKEHIKLVVGDKADKLAFDLTLEWLKLNVRRDGRIYFYYSGRGSMRRQTVTEYLLPKDGNPSSLDKTAVSLPAFLQELEQTHARDVVAIIDAGFSGAGDRSALPRDASLPRTIADPELAPRVVVVSAVTSAEAAGSSRDGSGVLTRWLIEGLGTAHADIDGDGQVTFQELLSWTGPRVTREAKRSRRVQTPTLLLGPGFNATSSAITKGLPAQ